MQVHTQPQRYISNDGNPIEHIEPSNTRWDTIDILRRDDTVILRARDSATEVEQEYTFDISEQMFKGVLPRKGRREDIDDDLIDAMLLVGFAVNDRHTRRF